MVELESPEIEGGVGGLGRGGSAKFGYRFVVGVEGAETASFGKLSGRTVGRKSEAPVEI